VTGQCSDVPLLVLDRDLRIRAVTPAYRRVTLHERDELLGQFLFDAFPDDPDDPQACGTVNLAASLETAMRSGQTHNMWIQRYDVRDPVAGTFVPKVWEPNNSPLFDHGELAGVVHRVEEISDFSYALARLTRAVEAGGSWSATEVLHTLAAPGAAESLRYAERRQGLIAETEQLRRAIETRDTIGQAKGMVMERFSIDAVAAFNLLVKLSQQTNTRVEQVARKLVDIDHPPRPS
jgi:hypothetical protein